MKKFELKQVNRDSYPRLQQLFSACFDKRVELSYFEWKYEKNPFGPVVGYEALDGSSIAGFYGLIPETYRVENKEFSVFQSMDTMTHPNYQRMGLFSLLAQKTIEQTKNDNGTLRLMGIPGHKALSGFTSKLHWLNPHSFSLRWSHSGYLGFLTSPRKFDWVGHPSPDQLKSYFSFRQPLQSFKQKAYSYEYFKWRIFDHPYRKLETLSLQNSNKVDGLAVYEKVAPNRLILHWLDSLTGSDRIEIFESLIIEVAKRNKLSWVYTWQPTEKQYASVLDKLNFLRNPFQTGPFSHKVPLILKVDGFDEFNWLDFNGVDWQPLSQD